MTDNTTFHLSLNDGPISLSSEVDQTPQQHHHIQQQQMQQQLSSPSPKLNILKDVEQLQHQQSQQQQHTSSTTLAATVPTTVTIINKINNDYQTTTGTQQQQQQQPQQQSQHQNIQPDINQTNNQHNFIGRLISKDNILLISESTIEIGRNSSKSVVHFHVGRNVFVSRKHLQLQYSNGEFYLICLSKNGIFVDNVFTRKSFDPIKLAKTCTLRFPSTNIRVTFENLTNENYEPNNTKSIKTVENTNVIYAPLKISIPETERKSPFPSPTGTISAANSCPTSPRQGFQEYSSYSNNSHNNNNNNNFQNDMFHPPSTSSYGEHEKPPYSYAQLIVQSISASNEKQLTLSGIYSFISKNYPYYRTGANKGWQNSIRHNLSLNRYFIKVPRSQDEPGKGSFWRIDPTSEVKLIDQSYRKRRQRGSQCFRSPFGMPRSAPVSPSHIDLLLHFVDNSRENSPLHDITMQSAPGSPGNFHNHSESHIEENYGAQNMQSSSYNSSNPYNLSSASVKREHNTDIFEDSEDYPDNDDYETIKRPKYSNE